MKATIHFSNNQIVTVEGVESLGHAENVADVLAVRYSASYGKPVFPVSAVVNEMNFSSAIHPDSIMQGVEVLFSVGGWKGYAIGGAEIKPRPFSCLFPL